MITRRKFMAGMTATPVALAAAVVFVPKAFSSVPVTRASILLQNYEDNEDMTGTIQGIIKRYKHEFNNLVTRTRLVNDVREYLNTLQYMGRIHDFKVTCDDTNNFGKRLSNNQLWVDVFYRPTRSLKFFHQTYYTSDTMGGTVAHSHYPTNDKCGVRDHGIDVMPHHDKAGYLINYDSAGKVIPTNHGASGGPISTEIGLP